MIVPYRQETDSWQTFYESKELTIAMSKDSLQRLANLLIPHSGPTLQLPTGKYRLYVFYTTASGMIRMRPEVTAAKELLHQLDRLYTHLGLPTAARQRLQAEV